MIIFYIITAVVLIALGYVFWLIWKERDQEDHNDPKDKSDNITAAGILERLGLKSQKDQQKSGKHKSLFTNLFPAKKAAPMPDQSDPFSTDTALENSPGTGTVSLRLDNAADQRTIDAEVELSIKNDELQHQLDDIQKKYTKNEQLLAEKNAALEKIQKELDHEQKHRKDFNKVKDLLEKELKETKDSAKRYQTDYNLLKSESQTYTNRIAQLEEKIKLLEKTIDEKEKLILDKDQEFAVLKNKMPSQTAEDPAQTHDTSSKDSSPEAAEAGIVETPKNNNTAVDNKSSNITSDPLTENKEQPERDNEKNSDQSAADQPLEQAQGDISPSPSPESEKQKITDSQESNPEKLSEPLNLNPISNLEPDYETHAAPKTPQIEEDSLTSVSETGNKNTEKSDAHAQKETLTDMSNGNAAPHHPEETDTTTESPETDKTPDSKDSQETAEKSIDDFLNEHLPPKPPSANSTIEPESNARQSPDSDETTKKTSPVNNDNSKNTEIEDKPDLQTDTTTKKPENDNSAPVSNDSNHPRLAPDIFKDIEEQFRKIEEEMNVTQEKQNIDTEKTDTETNAENDENQPDKSS